MSLVAYGPGSSDESDNEDDDSTSNNLQNTNINKVNIVAPETTVRRGINLPSPKNALNLESPPGGKNTETSSSLFSSLPLPKKTLVEDLGLVINENIFPGTGKKTVKITVPSLTQLKDDNDEPVKKKIKPSPKGSGLFSLLPAPKNATVKETKRAFVPHVLTKKQPAPPIKVNSTPSVVTNKPLLELITYADSGDDSDDSDGLPDFFSFNQESNEVAEILSDTDTLDDTTQEDPTLGATASSENTIEQPLAFVPGFRPTPWASSQSTQPGPSWQNSAEPASSLEEPFGSDDYLAVVEEEDLKLDDEALQRLCGRRAKKQQTPMEFIDVKGAELMPDPKEWLVKQLSEEQPKMRSHSHKKNDGPTTQQRRKHQITYLAFQAKESELELKNQWAQNRMSRKQTQSKYGF